MTLQLTEKSKVFVTMFLVVAAVVASMTLQVTISKARGSDLVAVEQQMKLSAAKIQKF